MSELGLSEAQLELLDHLPVTELWNALSERLGAAMVRLEDIEEDLADAAALLDQFILPSTDVCFCEACRAQHLAVFESPKNCPNCYPSGYFVTLKEPHGLVVCGFCGGDEHPLVRRHTQLRELLSAHLPTGAFYRFADDVPVPLPGEDLVPAPEDASGS